MSSGEFMSSTTLLASDRQSHSYRAPDLIVGTSVCHHQLDNWPQMMNWRALLRQRRTLCTR